MYDQLGPNSVRPNGFSGNPFGERAFSGWYALTFNRQEFSGQGLTQLRFQQLFQNLFRRDQWLSTQRLFQRLSVRLSGADIEADISITLEDAVGGGERSLT